MLRIGVLLASLMLQASQPASQPVNAPQPLQVTLGTEVLTSPNLIVKFPILPTGEPTTVDLVVKNLSAARSVIDAFSLSPEALATWAELDTASGLSTRKTLAPGTSHVLRVTTVPREGPQRKTLPQIVLATNWQVRNRITVLFAEMPREYRFETPHQTVTSASGKAWAHYKMCSPPPSPGFERISTTPILTGNDRGCTSWGSCDQVPAGEGEGSCYNFGVQGREKDSPTGNDKTVDVNIGIAEIWRLTTPVPRLLDQTAYLETLKAKK